jgi:hypothetical protein
MPAEIGAHSAAVAQARGLGGNPAKPTLFAEFSATKMKCVIGCLDAMRDY